MNCDELTKELSELYKGLKTGKIKPATALEMNRTATNIQANVRLELFNARLKNETPDLAFFKKSAHKPAAKTPARKAPVRTVAKTKKRGV